MKEKKMKEEKMKEKKMKKKKMKGEVFMPIRYISALCQLHKWKQIYTWEAMDLGWGETLENDHSKQQPVVAGLLAVKQSKYV